MQIKNVYKRELDAQVMEWNTQISQLAIKVEGAAADLKLKYAREINEIRAKQREATNQVRALEDTNGAAWEKGTVTADESWDEFGASLVQSLFRFR